MAARAGLPGFPDTKTIYNDTTIIYNRSRRTSTGRTSPSPSPSPVDTLSAQPECGSRELGEAGTWIRRSEKDRTAL